MTTATEASATTSKLGYPIPATDVYARQMPSLTRSAESRGIASEIYIREVADLIADRNVRVVGLNPYHVTVEGYGRKVTLAPYVTVDGGRAWCPLTEGYVPGDGYALFSGEPIHCGSFSGDIRAVVTEALSPSRYSAFTRAVVSMCLYSDTRRHPSDYWDYSAATFARKKRHDAIFERARRRG